MLIAFKVTIYVLATLYIFAMFLAFGSTNRVMITAAVVAISVVLDVVAHIRSRT